jgi:hypothetical protein
MTIADLLEQIIGDDASEGPSESGELELEVLPEARGVVVTQSLGISEGLQHYAWYKIIDQRPGQ